MRNNAQDRDPIVRTLGKDRLCAIALRQDAWCEVEMKNRAQLNVGPRCRAVTARCVHGRRNVGSEQWALASRYRRSRFGEMRGPCEIIGDASMLKAESAKSLDRVLAQTHDVSSRMRLCADDLSSVNTSIRRELGDATTPAIEIALQMGVDVQLRILKACNGLHVVNEELEGQLRERALLEHRFAAAIEQEEAARHAALHDALTDLPNRALFSDRLEHGLAQAKRHGWRLAVLFMDLDHFKKVNDLHGHHAGDCVLQDVAQRLMGNVREEDTVSRYGGDEFLYVLPDIQDEQSVASMAEKIIENVEAPYEIGVHGVNVSLRIKASIGIAIFPENGTTPEALLKSADAAMYRAKQSGSRYAFV